MIEIFTPRYDTNIAAALSSTISDDIAMLNKPKQTIPNFCVGHCGKQRCYQHTGKHQVYIYEK